MKQEAFIMWTLPQQADGFMSKKNFFKGAFGLLTCMQFAYGAESVSKSDEKQLEVITIEGEGDQKRMDHEQSFNETFTRQKVFVDEVAEQGLSDVKEAMSTIPGVRLKTQGAYTKKLSIRGMGGERVKSYLNGMQFSNQGLTHSGGGDANMANLDDLESIELVKGSPAVLYDPGAIGGVVEMRLRKLGSENHAGVRLKGGYESGYEKRTTGVSVYGGYEGFGLHISKANNKADAYNVKRKNRLSNLIEKTNDQDERSGTPYEIESLGFDDTSQNIIAQYMLSNGGLIQYILSDYEVNDATFTHGSADDRVFRIDHMERSGKALLGEFFDIGFADRIELIYGVQTTSREDYAYGNKSRSLVDSTQAGLRAESMFGEVAFKYGFAYYDEDATTLVRADIKYYGLYAQAERRFGDWTLHGGLRYNTWRSEQLTNPNQNQDVAADLVGISGNIGVKHESAPTYALGAIYHLTEQQNITLNFSNSYRYPSLYERYAYDAFIGGGEALKSEKAHTAEVGYRYLTDTFFITASLFYSQFEIFNGTKTYSRIIDSAALIECNRDPECNPFDNASDYWMMYTKYTSFEDVTNQGFEMRGDYKMDSWNVMGSVSMSEYEGDDIFVGRNSTPVQLEGACYYRPHIKGYKAFVFTSLRHVTDTPKVDQYEGFEPYTTINLGTGMRLPYGNVNIGVRNLTDAVYHEPYTALDGVERSFYVNFTGEYEALF